MDWKEFFNVTRAKIIITILFLSLSFLGLINFTHTCPISEKGNLYTCTQSLISKINPYFTAIFGSYIGIYIVHFLQFGNYKSILDFIFAALVGLIFTIIYNYLLASLIIYIFYKIKKSETYPHP